MICVKCGCNNDNETLYCTNCGKRLPDISMYNVMTSPTIIDSRLKLVIKLCEDIQKEKVTHEVYAEQLLNIHASISSSFEELREVEKEDGYGEYSPDEMEVGFRGLELWLAGIEEVYSYIDTLDSDLIKSGLKKIREGNDCINKAIYYNILKRDTEGTQGKI